MNEPKKCQCGLELTPTNSISASFAGEDDMCDGCFEAMQDFLKEAETDESLTNQFVF